MQKQSHDNILSKSTAKQYQYQHFFQPSQFQNKQLSQLNKKMKQSTDKFTSQKSNHQKKINKVNLKFQLQHLKNQVQKIIQKKNSHKQLPTYKKHNNFLAHGNPKINNVQKNEENQSCKSSIKQYQPMRKVESQKSLNNYDPVKYMQLQNNILKTQLKNLKQKYQQKKKQLTQKCQALQQKSNYLQQSLFQCQNNFQIELTSLKQTLISSSLEKVTLNSIQKNNSNSLIEINQEALKLRQKINKLYEELTKKNNVIFNLQQQIQKILEKSNIKQIQNLNQKITILQKQIIKLKNQNLNLKNQNQQYFQKLQQYEIEFNNRNYIASAGQIAMLHKEIDSMKIYYQQRIANLSYNLKIESQSKLKTQQQKYFIDQQLRYLKKQDNHNKYKIQQLTNKIRQLQAKNQQLNILTQKLNQEIKSISKEYQQKIKSIQDNYQSKLLLINSSSDFNKAKESNVSINLSRVQTKNSSNDIVTLEKQVNKWKQQYCAIRSKYESYYKKVQTKKDQYKQYFRFYKQQKQKSNITANKLKIIEKQQQKLTKILIIKEKQNLQYKLQIQNIQNQFKHYKYHKQIQLSQLNKKQQLLQQKLQIQTNRADKEYNERLQTQKKILQLNKTEDKQLKQLIDRMKKRNSEQEEKVNKLIKDQKNKQTQINKLKQQLRETIQKSEQKIKKQFHQKIKKISQQYLSKQFQSNSIVQNLYNQKLQVIQEQNNKLIQQLDHFKTQLTNKEVFIQSLCNQIDYLAHSYNLKCTENIQSNQNYHKSIQNLQIQIQLLTETHKISATLLRNELQYRDSDISSLKSYIIQLSKNYSEPNILKTGQYQQVFKNQIEQNKKLRQQIAKKIDQNFKLRQNLSFFRSQCDSLKSQIQISKLKNISQKKNIQVSFQVDIQNLKNQIGHDNKKISNLQTKIKTLFQQLKKKDSFIQSFIVGKKLSQNQKEIVINFMKQYQLTMQPYTLFENLGQQIKKIDQLNRYNRQLVTQISRLRDIIIFLQGSQQQYESSSSIEQKMYKKSSIFIEGNEVQSEFQFKTLKKIGSQNCLMTGLHNN